MESHPTQDIRLQGIGVSSGIILGKAFLVEEGTVEIPTYSLNEKDEIEKEIKIFLKAIDTTRSQFLETKKEIRKKGFKKGYFIIDAYLMILEDKLLIEKKLVLEDVFRVKK